MNIPDLTTTNTQQQLHAAITHQLSYYDQLNQDQNNEAYVTLAYRKLPQTVTLYDLMCVTQDLNLNLVNDPQHHCFKIYYRQTFDDFMQSKLIQSFNIITKLLRKYHRHYIIRNILLTICGVLAALCILGCGLMLPYATILFITILAAGISAMVIILIYNWWQHHILLTLIKQARHITIVKRVKSVN